MHVSPELWSPWRRCLPLLRSSTRFHLPPRACALGYILAPLRGDYPQLWPLLHNPTFGATMRRRNSGGDV